MSGYSDLARNMKADSFRMASLSEERRNDALASIAAALEAGAEEIFKANEKDLDEGKDLPAPILGRLKFDRHKLDDCVTGIFDLIRLPDPLFRKQLDRQLDEGLELVRVTCPIGVIGVFFESRPDALVQISALCIKSGNCAILRGEKQQQKALRYHI